MPDKLNDRARLICIGTGVVIFRSVFTISAIKAGGGLAAACREIECDGRIAHRMPTTKERELEA